MAKARIYNFTIADKTKNENGEMVNFVEFVGETKEESAKYVKMAGFTIAKFNYSRALYMTTVRVGWFGEYSVYIEDRQE